MTEKNDLQNIEDGEKINLRYYIFKALSIWYWFVISIAFFVVSAHYFILYSPLEFEAKSSLLVQDNSSRGGSEDIMRGFDLFNTPKKIENEIAILKSYQISEKTIKVRNNYVRYYKKGRLRTDNIYKDSPFFVVIDNSTKQLLGQYKISFNNGKITIESSASGQEGLYYNYNTHELFRKASRPNLVIQTEFDKWTSHDYLNIKIIRNPEMSNIEISDDEEFFFTLYSLNQLSRSLMTGLTVEPLSRQSDVINIKLTHDNRFEAVDILNSLLDQYFQDNLSEKNRNAISTIEFIDSQLGVLSDSLSSTEAQLEEFKKNNMVINIDAQSNIIFNQLQLYEGKLAMANLKMKYFEYLKDYISSATDYSDILVPSIMDVNDRMLNNLISKLLELNSEKIRILSSSTESNPLLNNINKQIDEVRKAINESVNSLINSTHIELAELKKEIRKFESEINKIPQMERTLIGIERSFLIDNEIYTYLLKKRAESSIAKASSMPDGKIIDSARVELSQQTRPKKLPIYAVFGLLGFILPIGFIVIRKNLYDFIEDKQDLETIIDLPVLGSIPRLKTETDFVMRDFPKSFVAESFRHIRTNLQFMLRPKKSNVILITSSMPKEGKTFTSINLAFTFANTGKKTILLGCDLRNPSLTDLFTKKCDEGISTYLSGHTELNSIIHKTEDEYLDIAFAGPIPPNPSELTGSERMHELLQELRKVYDYIIIDTSPINLTTDGLQIINHVNAAVYLVRAKYTRKSFLNNLVMLKSQGKLNNSAIVMNDISLSFSSRYSYNYNYKYARDYGYIDDEDRRRKNRVTLLKRIFKKNKV